MLFLKYLYLNKKKIYLIIDVSVSYVAQLDVVGSGMQSLDNDALTSSVGVEALGLMSNRLSNIGDKSFS